ncbi:hypothetical protein VIBNISOn1_710017 [Vibrio nigripulchritudo SOn1]|uniref:Uncharacterized protein n=1 Tax=Vibrio nigripulchritudo SOn1 TaxID=1238450 RepID=A0AAV2VW30_9VIBR|nr:hypothetical protein VIBNISOn1_710017 [Vibrio nigripulchritudo SOn1]
MALSLNRSGTYLKSSAQPTKSAEAQAKARRRSQVQRENAALGRKSLRCSLTPGGQRIFHSGCNFFPDRSVFLINSIDKKAVEGSYEYSLKTIGGILCPSAVYLTQSNRNRRYDGSQSRIG